MTISQLFLQWLYICFSGSLYSVDIVKVRSSFEARCFSGCLVLTSPCLLSHQQRIHRQKEPLDLNGHYEVLIKCKTAHISDINLWFCWMWGNQFQRDVKPKNLLGHDSLPNFPIIIPEIDILKYSTYVALFGV